jgi:hypothetical protein
VAETAIEKHQPDERPFNKGRDFDAEFYHWQPVGGNWRMVIGDWLLVTGEVFFHF